MAVSAECASMNTGSLNIKLCERTFARGHQRWRVDIHGDWSCYMWGWWPNGSEYPSGRYVRIAKDKVPAEIREAANG